MSDVQHTTYTMCLHSHTVHCTLASWTLLVIQVCENCVYKRRLTKIRANRIECRSICLCITFVIYGTPYQIHWHERESENHENGHRCPFGYSHGIQFNFTSQLSLSKCQLASQFNFMEKKISTSIVKLNNPTASHTTK